MDPLAPIFKLTSRRAWREAEAAGRFDGAPIDRQDGFIHFSTADQVRETAARHFAAEAALVMVAVDPVKLGDKLKWEPSRGGALFPHLYGSLLMDAVLDAVDVPLGDDGTHLFPSSVR